MDMVSWLIKALKCKKPTLFSSSLANTKVDHHLYYWQCGHDGHTKRDLLCREYPKNSHQLHNCKKNEEVKIWTKPKKK